MTIQPRPWPMPRRAGAGPASDVPRQPIGNPEMLWLGAAVSLQFERMTIQRMENVGIVVEDLAAATAFFVELGLKVLGEGPVDGDWLDRVLGLEGVRVDVAMLETLDGHGRLELMQFHAPTARGGDRHAPANTVGIRRVAFAVDDIDVAVAGLQARGAELVGGVERYEDSYRLCYVRGPEGIIVMLAEQIG